MISGMTGRGSASSGATGTASASTGATRTASASSGATGTARRGLFGSASTARTRDINANTSATQDRDDQDDHEDESDDDVEVLDESDTDADQLRGPPEVLVAKLTAKYKFLEPKFFALTKIVKSTTSKKRSDIVVKFACRNCPNASISAGVSSASNLRRHIKIKHPGLLKQYNNACEEQKKKLKSLKRPAAKDEAVVESPIKKQKVTQLKLFEVTQEAIDKRIIRFIIETNQSYRVVEEFSFKDIVLFGPGCADKKVMTRVTLAKQISEKFKMMGDNLRAELGNASVVCITADIWTAATRSFLGKKLICY